MKSICYVREIYLFNKIHFIDHTTAKKKPSLQATSSPVSTIPWIIKLAQQKIIKFVDYSLYMPVIPILVLFLSIFTHTSQYRALFSNSDSISNLQEITSHNCHYWTTSTKQLCYQTNQSNRQTAIKFLLLILCI